MNNGNNVNKTSLIEKIRALSFVKVELELYLDTHPNCVAAIDYYNKTLAELSSLVELYENTVGPLSASGVKSEETWTWVSEPWPWQYGNGSKKEARK